MAKLFFKTLGLFLLAVVVYFLHLYLLLPYFAEVQPEFLNFSYAYNLGATFIILTSMLAISFSTKEYLGFLYLLFGGIKLVLFVFLTRQKGFELDRIHFIHFFIPYLMGVLIEIYFVFQLLKDYNPKKIN